MKQLDFVSGGVLFAFAALLFWQTRELVVWGPFGPSSGFFPLGLSLLLAALSLIILFRAWMQTEKIRQIPKILGPHKRKFFFYLISFFAFALLFAKIGYTLTLVGFLTFILKFVENQSWKTTLAITLIAATISHLLFVRFLSVQLPEGLLSPFLRPM
jgi:hypothetical protein